MLLRPNGQPTDAPPALYLPTGVVIDGEEVPITEVPPTPGNRWLWALDITATAEVVHADGTKE